MNRRGFSLIEVIIALVILAIISLSLGRFVGSFLHTVGVSSVKTVATAAAQEQIELVRATPAYTSLVAAFNNNTVTGFPGYPNMTRLTRVTRTTGATPRRDYTTITVTVTEPSMTTPVNVTAVVAAP